MGELMLRRIQALLLIECNLILLHARYSGLGGPAQDSSSMDRGA